MPSLLASFEEPSIEDIINATLTDDEFLALEKAIEEDRKRSVQTGPPKPRPLGPLAPPKAEVDSMIGLLHVCYENEEWSTVAQLSLALLSAGVNWLPYLHARLALASAFLDPLGSAFGHATMSYQNYPDQAPAYIAIALCKLVVNQPHQALRWLRLASKASNLPQRVYQSLQKELKWTIAIGASRSMAEKGPWNRRQCRPVPEESRLITLHGLTDPYIFFFCNPSCIDDGRVKRLLPYFKMVRRKTGNTTNLATGLASRHREKQRDFDHATSGALLAAPTRPTSPIYYCFIIPLHIRHI